MRARDRGMSKLGHASRVSFGDGMRSGNLFVVR